MDGSFNSLHSQFLGAPGSLLAVQCWARAVALPGSLPPYTTSCPSAESESLKSASPEIQACGHSMLYALTFELCSHYRYIVSVTSAFSHWDRATPGVLMVQSIKPALAAHRSRGSCRNKAPLLVFLLLILFPGITASARGNRFATSRWAQMPASASGTLAGRERDVLALEPGKAILRELAGGASHSYQVDVGAGQYARVVVDQRRINVAVSVFDPAGKNIAEVDMFPIGDCETVSFVAEAADSYRLEVRSPDKAASGGSYEIKIREIRPATEQDKSAVAAERLVAEGILLVGQATEDSCRKAIEKYQQSIPLWQSAKDPAWEATALYLMGYLYVYLGEKEKAFDVTNRA